jgi:hypothetical protein
MDRDSMSGDQPNGNRDGKTALDASAAQRTLPAAAKRALTEAEARRKAYLGQEAALPKELGGRGGLDPNRYGDWEIKGLTADF